MLRPLAEVLLLLAVELEQLVAERLELQLRVVLVAEGGQVQIQQVRQELQDKEILEETLPVQSAIMLVAVAVALVLLEELQRRGHLPRGMVERGTLIQQGQVLLV
jgi:hypothetical protein